MDGWGWGDVGAVADTSMAHASRQPVISGEPDHSDCGSPTMVALVLLLLPPLLCLLLLATALPWMLLVLLLLLLRCSGHHGCGRDGNDGRRGEPPCDGPSPWRWSSFSIAAIWTDLAAPWTRLAAAWSVCHRCRLLTLNSKVKCASKSKAAKHISKE